ncbi:uncharacterized protein PHALS_05649 [Plasmopara halstedii]|uniref:Uncharacterized protein n=1 Tax=Plasmopara halstedii TaxID=4781 RepID=A0A0N7L7W1_PLAHL|nr:uncharacterized protein PHALS_05649 [Plasmopara halstedii]CEG48179.1 hypothetical protein PHALS_05649 [Plasmopara halstedii]|eukprot:XP_024584548.1 hypothetical protein PHALS_05649 [Plasmopara halstedii]
MALAAYLQTDEALIKQVAAFCIDNLDLDLTASKDVVAGVYMTIAALTKI